MGLFTAATAVTLTGTIFRGQGGKHVLFLLETHLTYFPLSNAYMLSDYLSCSNLTFVACLECLIGSVVCPSMYGFLQYNCKLELPERIKFTPFIFVHNNYREAIAGNAILNSQAPSSNDVCKKKEIMQVMVKKKKKEIASLPRVR